MNWGRHRQGDWLTLLPMTVPEAPSGGGPDQPSSVTQANSTPPGALPDRRRGAGARERLRNSPQGFDTPSVPFDRSTARSRVGLTRPSVD